MTPKEIVKKKKNHLLTKHNSLKEATGKRSNMISDKKSSFALTLLLRFTLSRFSTFPLCTPRVRVTQRGLAQLVKASHAGGK